MNRRKFVGAIGAIAVAAPVAAEATIGPIVAAAAADPGAGARTAVMGGFALGYVPRSAESLRADIVERAAGTPLALPVATTVRIRDLQPAMTSTLDRMEIIAYFDAGFAHSAKIPFYAWQYRAPTPRSKRVSSTAAFDIPGTAEIGVRYAVRDPKSGELAERSLRFSLGQVSTGVYALVADADASIRADFASLALGDEAGTLKYRGGMPLDRDYVTIEFRPAFD